MTALVPTCEPVAFTAGDSVEWTKVVADYPPSDGWTGAYIVVLSDSQVAATVTDDNQGEYTASFSASAFQTIKAQTEARLVGFVYTGTLAAPTERHVFYDARLTILPNVTGVTLTDSETQTEKELRLINAQIEKILGDANESYSISQRSAQKRKLSEAMAARALLEARLSRERGLPARRKLVQFASTG